MKHELGYSNTDLPRSAELIIYLGLFLGTFIAASTISFIFNVITSLTY